MLRALPDFPDELPDFDPASAPADPAELFRLWLDEALRAGVPQPNACSLATADEHGRPSSRMLILKDIDDDGWHFATSRASRKGRELSANPHAALNFFWQQQGRQVRVAGSVVELSPEASASDWHARPGADGSDESQPGSCTPSGPARSSSGRPGTTAGTSATATARSHSVNPDLSRALG